MTPEEFDIDFDFDKVYADIPTSAGKSDGSDDFDLDAALARELGPDFDALFEKEYEESQAALNAELEARDAEARQQAEAEERGNTRLFQAFDQMMDEDDEEENAAAKEDVVQEQPAAEEAAEPADAEEFRMTPPERRPRKKPVDLSALTERIDLAAISQRMDLKGKVSGMGQAISENSKSFTSALKDCKPGKMDKKQRRRFKDDVLPFLIGAAALVVCLVFIFGSLSRNIDLPDRHEEALKESMAQAQAEAEAAAEIQRILEKAAALATAYDYEGAISTIDAYKDPETGRELTHEMAAARTEYAAAQAGVVVWDDPAAIANLSFHVLIEDAQRAYADPSFAGSYRKNFVTTAQFSSILEQLYEKGYVLVNLDSCITEETDELGNTICTVKPIYLPEGKTPIMITETLVNYFDYMISGSGAGFASRLVIQGGKIQAEYTDAAGNTQVGAYDLVPILDDFIDAHPDFSYRGAKAILAVTGEEGIFGWRTNADESLIPGVQDVVEVLRAEGYQIACNSFDNLDYGSTSLSGINTDIASWNKDITPILGEVDILVIARGGSLSASGDRYSQVREAGFRYIIDAGDAVGGTLATDGFLQHRIMVVGSKLNTGVYDAYFTITD